MLTLTRLAKSLPIRTTSCSVGPPVTRRTRTRSERAQFGHSAPTVGV